MASIATPCIVYNIPKVYELGACGSATLIIIVVLARMFIDMCSYNLNLGRMLCVDNNYITGMHFASHIGETINKVCECFLVQLKYLFFQLIRSKYTHILCLFTMLIYVIYVRIC